MSIRIDIGDAGVVALEVEPVRRDRTIESLERRARCAGAGRARRTRKRPDDLCFEPRRLPVTGKRRSRLPHPWFDREPAAPSAGRAAIAPAAPREATAASSARRSKSPLPAANSGTSAPVASYPFRPLSKMPSGFFSQSMPREVPARKPEMPASRRLGPLDSWRAATIDALLSNYTCRERSYAIKRGDVFASGHGAARSAARPRRRLRPPDREAGFSRDLGHRLARPRPAHPRPAGRSRGAVRCDRADRAGHRRAASLAAQPDRARPSRAVGSGGVERPPASRRRQRIDAGRFRSPRR